MLVDYKELPRNKRTVLDSLKTRPDGSVVALCDLEVHFLHRYVENGLADVSDAVEVIALIGFVIPNNCFCSFIAPCKVTLNPSNIREMTISEDKYTVLEFNKGDVVFLNKSVPIYSKLSYNYYQELIYGANLSWFIDKKKIPSKFDLVKYYCKTQLTNSPHVIRVLYSLTLRDPDDIETPYRYSSALKDGKAPEVVGLNNPGLLVKGTLNKIGKGYLRENELSAMLNPSKKINTIEKITRGIPDE